MASVIGKKNCARVLALQLGKLRQKSVERFAPNHTTTNHQQVIKKPKK